MPPEHSARQRIDARLEQSGWLLQDFREVNPMMSLGVAVREYPTDTGPVDYALFVDGKPVGVIEAKKDECAESITAVEGQTGRYAHSTFKYVTSAHKIRFAYEATGQLTRFTDYADIKYRSRPVFSFHRPETLLALLARSDTIRNALKHFPIFDATGFRQCQIAAIQNLEVSFAANRPKALVQMATGAGKTFTAITAAYRLLKFGNMKRILFLVDTKSLGEQAEREFLAYTPNDDNRSFSQLYGVRRLNSSHIPSDIHICISTIQRMYSLLKGEEMDASVEEESLFEQRGIDAQPAKEVVYNAKYPPEFFDCIIVDECHRSIYNVWNQVLEYFDAFIIGLTATPDKRTFAFFNQNIVSEYSREQAIIDGVNVGEDIFLIETDVTKHGAHLMKQQIECRNRQTRVKRWKQMDEDIDYTPSVMDRDVVNPSQIRTVIRTFKECLPTQLFPHRQEVPKTLIFAKTDSHADDIIQIVRDEFGEGNEFCQKITCKADRPETVLSAFRNDYYPRIAVTVDMIATGTDVKAIECLVFMRDVRSRNYFEQMKGRGTRTLGRDALQKVTPSATGNKDHFVIVDAVGVTKSTKTETRTLERKPTVSLRELMLQVAMGAKDEDTLTSLANRLIRLNNQMTEKERSDFSAHVGGSASVLAQGLLDAFDVDVIADKAGVDVSDGHEPTMERGRGLLESINAALGIDGQKTEKRTQDKDKKRRPTRTTSLAKKPAKPTIPARLKESSRTLSKTSRQRAALLWEYTCSECGSRFKTDVPPEARTVFGSWLAAMIGVMTALGMTRRHIQTFFEQTADIDISQGGIQKCLDRVSLSIQPHYDAIARESRRVPVSHVDETSSRLFGPDGEEKHWLWVMVCPTLCFFMIHTTRSAQAFSDLVGDRAGILVSDGYAFYQKWAGVARQSCLSHLIRKARQFAESDTPEKASGGHWILAELRRLVKMAHNLPTKGQYLAWKGRFTRCVNKWWRSGHLCPYARHLLLEADYIVTFLKYKGIDPTNNAAEKALCPYVCHKKISFGATSLHGEDDIAKLLTIHETCRPNSRSSYAELKTALECYARGKSSTVNWI